MKEHLDISSLLKESAEQHLVTTPDESWNVIKNRLHQKKKRRIAYWWFTGFIALAITGSLFLLTSQNNKEDIVSAKENQQKASEPEHPERIISNIENNTPNNNNVKIEAGKNAIYIQNTDIENSNSSSVTVKNIVTTQTNTFSTSNKTAQKKAIVQKEKIKSEATKVQEVEIDLVKEEAIIAPLEIAETKTDESYVKDTLEVSEKNTQTTDSLLSDSKKNQTIISEKVVTKTVSKKPKWNTTLQLNVNKVFVSDNSIFSALEKNMNSQTTSTFSTDNIRGVSVPNFYEKAFSVKAAFLFNKPPTKKINFHYGVSLQYFQYSLNVFNAPWADVRVVNNSLTTNPVGNSFNNSTYTAVPNYLTTLIKYQIENHAWLLGGVIGANMDIKKISPNTVIKLQTQLTSSIFLDQRLHWFNNSNNRFFEDKSLTRKLLLEQNASILFQTKLNKATLSIGPSVQWNWNNANKKTSGLNNLNWTSIGLQTQIRF